MNHQKGQQAIVKKAVGFRLEVVVADPRGSTTTTEAKLRNEMPRVEDALKTRAHEIPAYRFSKDLLS